MEVPEVILVAVDFTEPTLNALAVAITLSYQQQWGIHLIYVLPPHPPTAEVFGKMQSDAVNDDRVGKGEQRIQELATIMAQKHQIPCFGSCRVGVLQDEVVAMANVLQVELIVMGTHIGSDRLAFQTSNDAYQVITKAHCPVLTIPDSQKWSAFERILFPVRPVPNAANKYEFARKLIQMNKVDLTVVALSAPDEVISLAQVQDEISELKDMISQDGVSSQTLFCTTESMAETVLTKADELHSDILIITAWLATTMDSFFIGSFTQQIIHNTRIPVLSIRPESGVGPTAVRFPWK